MTRENRLEELAATLHKQYARKRGLNAPSFFRRLIVLLAEGQPVSRERLATNLGRSREGVTSTFVNGSASSRMRRVTSPQFRRRNSQRSFID